MLGFSYNKTIGNSRLNINRTASEFSGKETHATKKIVQARAKKANQFI
jgi:hypothetical protein